MTNKTYTSTAIMLWQEGTESSKEQTIKHFGITEGQYFAAKTAYARGTQVNITIKQPKVPVTESIQHQIQSLQQKLQEEKQKERSTALQQIKAMISIHNVTQDELFIGKSKWYSPVRYYDPNTGSSWNGRGRKPNWLYGKDLSKFLVS